MQIDNFYFPFSYPGSYVKINTRSMSHSGRLLISSVSKSGIVERHMEFWPFDFFEIALVKNEVETSYTFTALPWRLDLITKGGESLSITFADPDTFLFDLHGVELRLLPCHPFDWSHRINNTISIISDSTAWKQYIGFACDDARISILPSALCGPQAAGGGLAMQFTGGDKIGAALRINATGDPGDPPPSFEDTVKLREREYRAWDALMPKVAMEYENAARSAWYHLWSLQVAPAGGITRRGILISKEWMNSIWSWNNCFNAIALATADPALAFDQVLLMFDRQDKTGKLPDMINDAGAFYEFVKPPVYGWTIMKMIEKTGMDTCKPYFEQLYPGLVRLSNWWYGTRDSDNDGMCEYWHGNDSGWDNSTIFDQGQPTEGADLAAFLVLQSEALALMASELGRCAESESWHKRARIQLETLLSHSVKNNRFFSPLSGTHETAPTMSLINCMPVVLGHRLPEPVRKTLTNDLSDGGPFLTVHGLATESPRSKKYISDGYWRGPIWAPSTFIAYDGLIDIGEKNLATEIARRFCNMCVRNPGMFENYDALSGKGQFCPGDSWTSAVFIMLAHELSKS